MTGAIVEVTFPAADFALKRTLDTLETVQFDVEQLVAHDRDRLTPFVWDQNERPRDGGIRLSRRREHG